MHDERRRTRAAEVLAALVVVAVALSGCAAQRPEAPSTTSASSVRVVPPPAGAPFDYQIGGASTPMAGARIVDRDRADPPAPGVYSICYVNAFQTQPGEAATWTGSRAALLLRTASGAPVEDPDWPGESVLDISTAAKRSAIAGIVGRWIDGCAAAGYDAMEPDNLDTWTRWPSRLTEADALAYSRLLVERAHSRGLAVAQKNAPDLGTRGRSVAGFDFAIAEECTAYDECGAYLDAYGQHVIDVEYTDGPRSAFTAACRVHGRRISVLLRDRDVLPAGRPGRHAEWCPR